MPRLIPHLARFLLVVLLLSVLSPAIGIDLVQTVAQLGRGHDAVSASSAHTAQAHVALASGASDAMSSMMEDCTDCPGHAPDSSPPCHDQQHHCCPGHLVAYPALAASLVMQSRPRDLIAVDWAPQHFSSRIPAGLERPPRLAVA